jgi:hypothetical protein
VKFTLNILEKHSDDQERHWPSYIFGGRMRTSTLVLIVAFLALWWVYDTYRPQESAHEGPPATQVVPPGFVPDPNYTWVPRSRVPQPPSFTPIPTPTTAVPTTTPPPPPTTTTTTPPPFVLPTLPCLPPFCTPSTTPTPAPPQPPQPGPGLSPTSAPPAG